MAADKQTIRERVWDCLEAEGIALFPFPPHGRIPNFDGADEAAKRLAATEEWQSADAVKANPDAPQLPIRRRALQDGKTVYMAVPRLADPEPFVALDPDRIDDGDLDSAPTVSHMDDHGVPVGPDELPHVDLVVSGSVAVTEQGARIGKGEGFSDLEFAVLSALGAVDADTAVATTVHEAQVPGSDAAPVDADAAPDPEPHDVPMDLVVTPTRTVRTDGTGRGRDGRPTGIDWDRLSDEQIDEMPVLQALAPERD